MIYSQWQIPNSPFLTHKDTPQKNAISTKNTISNTKCLIKCNFLLLYSAMPKSMEPTGPIGRLSKMRKQYNISLPFEISWLGKTRDRRQPVWQGSGQFRQKLATCDAYTPAQCTHRHSLVSHPPWCSKQVPSPCRVPEVPASSSGVPCKCKVWCLTCLVELAVGSLSRKK